jgi:hypothetical protein
MSRVVAFQGSSFSSQTLNSGFRNSMTSRFASPDQERSSDRTYEEKTSWAFALDEPLCDRACWRLRSLFNKSPTEKEDSTVNNKVDERQLDSFDWEKAAGQLAPASDTAVSTGEAVAHIDTHFDGHIDGHNDKPLLC